MFHLLGQESENHEWGGKAERPTFFDDLNLDQIIDRVTKDWGAEVQRLYYVLPEDPGTEAYRREIYGDVKGEKVFQAMMEFRKSIREWRRCMERGEKVEDDLQKRTWHLRETECYAAALETLRDALLSAKTAGQLNSRGMQEFLGFLSACVAEPEYQKHRQETAALWKELSGFHILLTYEKERFTLVEGKGTGKYEGFLEECFPGHGKIFRSPFLASDDFSSLEAEILKQFRKKHKEFFVRLEKYCQMPKPYVHEELLRLFPEMGYYLSFAQFERKMLERGLTFCTPERSGAVKTSGGGAEKNGREELSAKGLYDLALALVNADEGKEVVPNDALLLDGEDFFVLTGPNQGGKTTYARSLGQLIYFTKMGLDVPAFSATVPYFRKLWTHFSVEESAQTGRGKLMDELVRLKPMMTEGEEGAFIVINELFTTAANYDANVMGKRVLEFFVNHHCKGIYVTHLSELSRACKTVVSLRAGVDEKGKQNYEIQRSEAQEISGANIQVEKYGLTYRQLKERFS